MDFKNLQINEFQLFTFKEAINQHLNPIHDDNDEWLRIYLLCHSLVYYYEYAAAQTEIMKLSFEKKCPDSWKVSSAIAAYLHIHNCWKMSGKVYSNFNKKVGKNVKDKTTKKYINKQIKDNLEKVRKIRDRLAGHPEAGPEEYGDDKHWWIVSKRSRTIESNKIKSVTIPHKNLKDLQTSEFYELEPYTEMVKLNKILENMGTYIINEIKNLS